MKPEDVEVNMTLNQFKPYYLTIPDQLVELQKIRSSVLNKNTNFIETTLTNHNDLGAGGSRRGRRLAAAHGDEQARTWGRQGRRCC